MNLREIPDDDLFKELFKRYKCRSIKESKRIVLLGKTNFNYSKYKKKKLYQKKRIINVIFNKKVLLEVEKEHNLQI